MFLFAHFQQLGEKINTLFLYNTYEAGVLSWLRGRDTKNTLPPAESPT